MVNTTPVTVPTSSNRVAVDPDASSYALRLLGSYKPGRYTLKAISNQLEVSKMQGEFINVARVGQYEKGGSTYFVLQKVPDARFAQAGAHLSEDYRLEIWAGECTGNVCATLSILQPGDKVALQYEEAQDGGRTVRLYRAADIM